MDVADRGNFPVAPGSPCRQLFPRIIVRANIPLFQPSNMKTQSRCFRARVLPVRGFTLIEVMTAMAVFVMVTLGIYQMLFQSYQMVRTVRYRDAARAVLESFGDQFLRLETTDVIGGVITIRPLFLVRAGGDMTGIKWDDPAHSYAEIDGTTSGLTVYLGQVSGSTFISASPIQANVTQAVTDLNDTTGVPTSTVVYTAAGRMLQSTFTITYTLGNRIITQTLTVARSVR
jgi:prepilin-type N-terminal cleavage/methylation domain-containing protein